MKYLLPLLFFLFSLLLAHQVFAATLPPQPQDITPTLYCLGSCPHTTANQSAAPFTGASTNPNPSGSSSSPSPSTSPAPSTSTSPSPSLSPCPGQSSVSLKLNKKIKNIKRDIKELRQIKKHYIGKNGFIRKLINFLIKYLERILNKFIKKQKGHLPCPSPSPSVSPSPSTPVPSISQAPSPSVSPSNCQPDSILVNPCRPWVGAAANGNPGAPGSPVGKDKISQFDYLEQLLGRSLDIFRDYDGLNTPPLNSNELHFAKRPNTYIDINWKPAGNWASANGSDPTVNANIDKAAASIKSVAPNKIFLSIWHEPQNDVSSFDNAQEQTFCNNDPNFKGLVGHAGTPSQYIAMWQNVENRFKSDGVTNVVWVMNYMSYAPFDCLVPMLWPGNNVVDWVIYDTYSRGKTWDQTAGVFYKTLENDNSQTFNVDSKPWGIGEFGTCKQPTTGITSDQYFQSLKSALDANTYPRLKMYLVYADTGNNAGPGCLTNYDVNGQYDPQKQAVFNQLFNDPIFK